MTEQVTWRPVAFADLAKIIAHIHAENPIAAQRVGRELLLAADSLAIFQIVGDTDVCLERANW
ncbi:type II toxin-antitoxin system RelE/ParE family toxin [Nitrospirillum sp. BR 11164]|nr:type II toxin-antitoxin system RelE/ParE family toxin [Nitrospirillum sp. BR 11164]MEA1648948.1 type II toxin-antitoxin system RelE/ParE family toxin [Nitrospirillum sp. BR 11164]